MSLKELINSAAILEATEQIRARLLAS